MPAAPGAARAPRARRAPVHAPDRAARPGWRIEPVTPGRWPDLERLFGPRGACAGCWCMFMRLPNAEFRAGQGEKNRRALRALAERRPPGLIAYHEGEPVGWIAVAPRGEFARLATSRVLAPVPGERVWAAPCLFVKAGHRGRGLSAALVVAAAGYARKRGAASLEGYPHSNRAERQPAAFVWTGFESSFRRAGFREIARRSPGRPIMRVELGPPARRAATGGPRAATGGPRAARPARGPGARRRG